MMRKRLLTLLILLVSVGITTVWIHNEHNLVEVVVEEKPFISPPSITCQYYNERSFMISVRKAEEAGFSDLEVLGGVTPHHLLADHMIAQFFKAISTNLPKTVILIGPNHERLGTHRIQTGKWNWQTPFGMLEADKDIVKQIIEKTGAEEDMSLLEMEHSIAALIPYVKYYLPEAKVVPLILHGNLGLDSSMELANTLLECIGEREYIVIGSVDFSHYLPPNEAEQMDEISIKAIKERDFLAISRMDNDYLDSPPTIMTLLELMNKERALYIEVIDHSNSSEIAGEYFDSTTSYFTILLYRDTKE